MLRGSASLAAVSLIPGCGYHANTPHASGSSYPFAPSSGSSVEGSVVVAGNTIGTIPARFMGLSYEKFAISYSYFHPSNHDLIALFKQLGKGVLRLGGGSVDRVLWTGSEIGTHGQVSPANIRALATFLQATDWLCLYGLNLATSTPAAAAEEAAYAAAILGEHLLGIEIGNEPDEYGLPGHFFAGNWTPDDLIARWSAFRSAIVAETPGISLTGPAGGGGDHIESWTLPFGQAVTSSEINLLTQHYYRMSGASPDATAAFLISPDTQLTAELADLDAGAQQLGIPYRLSECNSFSSGGAPGVSNTYASSLWVIDFLLTAALGGAGGVNLHGGGDGPGYSPIADHSGSVIGVRPEYYGLLLFTLMGTGALLPTQLSINNAATTAYALKMDSGGVNVMLVNKDSRNVTITVDIGRTIQAASLQLMTAPGLNATTGVTIQGATMSNDGRFAPVAPDLLPFGGSQALCYVPALSAALISIM